MPGISLAVAKEDFVCFGYSHETNAPSNQLKAAKAVGERMAKGDWMTAVEILNQPTREVLREVTFRGANTPVIPYTSAGDEGVISVDFSRDVLEDSFTEMAGGALPPDLIVSAEPNPEDDTTKLTLAYERLYEIPKTIVERFSDHIKYLDISHNKITNLDCLVYFKHLTSLIADHNPITENCVLPPLPKLELLWLNHCKISSLYPWVGKLKESCPNIQYLCLMGNPAAPSYFNGGTFYEYLQYRLFVISQFPSLNHLDDRRVTEDQRAEAHRLYRRPLVERIPGVAHVMNSTLSWSQVQEKINNLLGKDRRNRNLLI